HLREAQAYLATGADVRLLHGSVAVRPYTGEVLHAGHQGGAHHVPEVDVVVRARDAADEAGVRVGELELVVAGADHLVGVHLVVQGIVEDAALSRRDVPRPCGQADAVLRVVRVRWRAGGRLASTCKIIAEQQATVRGAELPAAVGNAVAEAVEEAETVAGRCRSASEA